MSLSSPSAPSVETAPDVQTRLNSLEAFGEQVSASIDELVSVVLELKQATQSPELAALQQKVKDLEQQLQIERSCRDLAQVSRMHHKTRSVVFVGTTYFGCNVKYAWLGVRDAARAQGVACRFLPFNAEQEALVRGLGGDCLPHSHSQWTPEHLHQALSAGVLVTSDHFLNPNPFAAALLAGARHVQLWHGVSIKEIGLRNLPAGRALGAHSARVLATCGPYASFVGTASHAQAEWRRWFAFEHYAPIGYPRNDVLYREPSEADLANVDRNAFDLATRTLQGGKRVFLYAPTFRDANRGRWLLQSGIDRVAAAVARDGDCLLVNLHPVEQPMLAQLGAELPGVTLIAPRSDVYPLLARTSALITDYSSVMFDYLHLKRPLLLFRPDHEAYTERSRRLFDAKLDSLPGPLLTNADTLAHHLRSAQLGQSGAHRKAREQLLARWFDHHDGNSAQRLWALIDEHLQALPNRA